MKKYNNNNPHWEMSRLIKIIKQSGIVKTIKESKQFKTIMEGNSVISLYKIQQMFEGLGVDSNKITERLNAVKKENAEATRRVKTIGEIK